MSEKKGEYKTHEFTLKRFRKKPEEIEAVQWTGGNFDDAMEIAELVGATCFSLAGSGNLVIKTPQDFKRIVTKNDWIVKRQPNSFYVLSCRTVKRLFNPIPEGKG